MTVEVATYIHELVDTYPEGTADRSEADNHLRLIKAAVKATFPNFTGPTAVTQASLNMLVGLAETMTTVLARYSTSISAIKTSVATAEARLVSMSALNTKYSLSIVAVNSSVSALNTDVSRISVTVSALWTKTTALSNSVSVVKSDVARISQTVSVVIAAQASDHAALITVINDVGRISVTVSALWTKTTALSNSVSVVKSDIARISQTVSVAISRMYATDTAQSATTTLITFSIPSWARRITIGFAGVSTSGTDAPQIRIGDAGGVEASGYAGTASNLGDDPVRVNLSSGFDLTNTFAATFVIQGVAELCWVSGNTWAFSSVMGRSDLALAYVTAGYKTLSAALTQVQLTAQAGNVLDAGIVNVHYV